MIGSRAVARRSIRLTNSVSILRDLHRRPIVLAQRGNQTRNHAGFPHASRMPANHDDCHPTSFSPTAPALPTASDTAAPAAPEFPRTPHPCPVKLCSATHQPFPPHNLPPLL